MAFNFGILAGLGEAAQAKQESDRQDRSQQRDNLTKYWGVMAESKLVQKEMNRLAEQNLLMLATAPINVSESKWNKFIKPLMEMPSTIAPTTEGGRAQARRQQTTYEDVEGVQLPQPEGLNISPDTWGAMGGSTSFRIPVPAPWSDEYPEIPAYMTDAQHKAARARARQEESAATITHDVALQKAMLPGRIEEHLATLTPAAKPSVPAAVQFYNLWVEQQVEGANTSYEAYLEATRPSTNLAGNALYAELFAKIEKGTATPDETLLFAGLQDRITYSASANYARQNPEPGPGEAEYWVRQLESNAQNWNMISGNPALANQVRRLLAEANADPLNITASTRSLGEISYVLVEKIDKTLKMLEKPSLQGELGPVMSRWNEFLAGTLGSFANPDFVKLRTTVSLDVTGTMRAHMGARGAVAIMDRFDKIMNVSRMDLPTLRGSLEAVRDFLAGYAEFAGLLDEASVPGAEPSQPDGGTTFTMARVQALADKEGVSVESIINEIEEAGGTVIP
jgi:hypothetical protein